MAANSRNSTVYVQANYEIDIPKTITKNYSITPKSRFDVNCTPSPTWREKFHSISLESNSLLYLDECGVLPKDMRDNMLTAIHFGHTGRDAVLREAANVWWPRNHREIVEKANNYPECIRACKSIKFNKNQKSSERYLRLINHLKKFHWISQAPFKMHLMQKNMCKC